MFIRHAAAAMAAALLVVAAMASFWAQCAGSRAALSPEDWREATELAIELSLPDDAIRVHPTWTETPLPLLRPVGNLLHRQQAPILEDFAHTRRVLIVTENARRDEALAALPFPVPSASDLEEHRFQRSSVLVVPIPEAFQIHLDLSRRLEIATVNVVSTEEQAPRPCGPYQPRIDGFSCPGHRTDGQVRPVLLEIKDDPRRCIQAFPPAGEAFLRVEIPLGDLFEEGEALSDEMLRLRGGLDERAARLEGGDLVLYRVFLNGELVREARLHPERSTWDALDLADLDAASTLTVEVESAAPEPFHRRFCFNGWLLSPEAQRSNL